MATRTTLVSVTEQLGALNLNGESHAQEQAQTNGTHGSGHDGQGFGTLAVHAGQTPDPVTGAVIPSISLSTTFLQRAPNDPIGGYDYSRAGNPTRANFEEAVAKLEKGTKALAYASGSAATSTIINMIPTGSHVILVNDVYGGTFRYMTKVASQNGIEFDFVELTEPNNIEKYIKPNTRLVWCETPTNPTLRLVDIRAISTIIARYNSDPKFAPAPTRDPPLPPPPTPQDGIPRITFVIDNTFMSPYNQNPLTLGADVVVHSVTKYLGGHSDVVMGVAVTSNPAIYARLKFLQNAIGAIPSPFDCWLAHRGLKTLHLRMQAHERNALRVATYLSSHAKVIEAIYPGLPSHPQHELAKRQQKGFGGMVSFMIKGGKEEASRFLSGLKLFALAESLGGVESLAELPSQMTHASLTPEARAALGVTDSLVRLSVGVEEIDDLIGDLEQALVKV
ncbi:cystathionine gamma-lyase [Gonapodya prolifera JEL478]|uniref:cystathionine gamma-lyase n=1 Tax=Gonapodya prolifera (strain JEL478) TaxID=1344416 RepID=A0A139AKK6_GONPJ|nr:cystathionine gamma-lyase [Gonapodya prolifera JEL478]|eukprot:KXS17228.1 cystathionine gamma-lyase [Gonapodya prolifera JEL478]